MAMPEERALSDDNLPVCDAGLSGETRYILRVRTIFKATGG